MTNALYLGQRLTDCKHFHWIPGMRTFDGCRVLSVDPCGLLLFDEVQLVLRGWKSPEQYIPDVFDFATKGCLLELVRGAWSDGSITHADVECFSVDNWMYVIHPEATEKALLFPPERHGVKWFDAPTEAEAMICALEAAPCEVNLETF